MSTEEKVAAFFKLMDAKFDEAVRLQWHEGTTYTMEQYYGGKADVLAELYEAAEHLGLHENYSRMPI